MNKNPCKSLMHNIWFLFSNNYGFPNWILVTTSGFAFNSGVFKNHSDYVKQVGSGLEIIKIRDVKVEGGNKKSFSHILFIFYLLFYSFYRKKGRKHITFLLHYKIQQLYFLSNMNKLIFSLQWVEVISRNSFIVTSCILGISRNLNKDHFFLQQLVFIFTRM